METAESTSDTPSYYKPAIAGDWERAINQAREDAVCQTGSERFSTLVAAANFLRLAGEWERARKEIEEAWAFAQRLDPTMLAHSHYLNCAETAEILGVSHVSEQALAGLQTPVTNPSSSMALAHRLKQALSYSAELTGRPTKVIPMGQECLPYSILMRWGFREFAVEGPFTAGVFNGAGPALAMQDDFIGFCGAEHYKVIRSPQGKAMPVIPRYQAALNHETGPYFCENSLKELLCLYERRVDNFRTAMRSSAPIVLLIEQTAMSDIPLIVSTARTTFPLADLRFLVLDYQEEECDAGNQLEASGGLRLRVLSTPRPSNDYIWHLPEWYNSHIGLNWEASIAAAIAEMIRGDS